MTEQEYFLCVEKTIDMYSEINKKQLVKEFINENIAFKRNISSDIKGQLNLENAVDITDMNLSDQVLSCFHYNPQTIYYLEKREFIKDYKYSVLFTCNDFTDFYSKVKNIKPLNSKNEHDYISNKFGYPVIYHQERYSFLKYNLKFSATHPNTGEPLSLKYPLIVVLHNDEQFVEFRFDTLKRIFTTDSSDSVYSELISNLRDSLRQQYDCVLTSLDLDFMVNVCKKDPNVNFVAQFMKTPNGGNAQLAVGNNEEYTLPFIDELNSILKENVEELRQAPKLSDALNQFLFEIVEMSDYPWIEVNWSNKTKAKSNHVKFIFNYMSNSYCLIYYYSKALYGMERMNNVVKYIGDHRDSLK